MVFDFLDNESLCSEKNAHNETGNMIITEINWELKGNAIKSNNRWCFMLASIFLCEVYRAGICRVLIQIPIYA